MVPSLSISDSSRICRKRRGPVRQRWLQHIPPTPGQVLPSPLLQPTHILDQLTHLHWAEPALFPFPGQAVHQLLQILLVQCSVIIKVLEEKAEPVVWSTPFTLSGLPLPLSADIPLTFQGKGPLSTHRRHVQQGQVEVCLLVQKPSPQFLPAASQRKLGWTVQVFA